jgi:hypothetical protein
MRLSVFVLAFSLILFFSPSIQAQHSSGGGGGGGGHSGGGGGGGSSGGGGGGSSGGGSRGGSSSHSSGSSGSAHGGSSSHGGSMVKAPDKIGAAPAGSAGMAKGAYYSTVPGDSSAVRDPLLNEALARIRIEVPAALNSVQSVGVDIQKRKDPAGGGSAAKKTGTNKAEAAVKIRFPKHCHGKKCVVPPSSTCTPTGGVNGCGEYAWRVSEDVYNSIYNRCGYLAQQLAHEESKATAVRGHRETVCSSAEQGSVCTSAIRWANESDARIARLREQYQRCVFSDLRHSAVVSVSGP